MHRFLKAKDDMAEAVVEDACQSAAEARRGDSDLPISAAIGMSSGAVTLNVSLFGRMQAAVVDAHGQCLVVNLAGQARQLLALLTLAGGVTRSRPDLCRELWSESVDDGPDRAACLNTALWRLRRALQVAAKPASELLHCDRQGRVTLLRDGRVVADWDEFRAALPLLAKPLASLQLEDVACMQAAVQIYSDDFLADFDAAWALRERETMRRHQLNLLGRLMQCCALSRDVLGAIRYGQMVLDIDPLREDIHRELMRLYVLSGQRPQALMQFEICRDVLRRELAIAPMPETLALYQHIADAAVGRHPAAPSETPPRPSALPASDGAAWRPSELLAQARTHLAAADAALLRAQPLLA